MPHRPEIAIIGAGKVGTALGVLAAKAGYRVAAVGDASAKAADEAAAAIEHGARACSPREAAKAGGLVLLTVPDDAIEALCHELAQAGALAHGPVLAHCSGALSSEVLAEAARAGCPVGSMHPLQTFPTVQAAIAAMPGTYFFCEGDEGALASLEELAAAVGGRCVRIIAQAKALYHAAAVMACNYLTALLDAAFALADAAGIEPATAREALGPLVRATVDNVLAIGPEQALTGPIARGDVRTVRRHVEALRRLPGQFRMVYSALGGYTVELAARRGTIDSQTAATMWQMLLSAAPTAQDAHPRRSRRPRGPGKPDEKGQSA